MINDALWYDVHPDRGGSAAAKAAHHLGGNLMEDLAVQNHRNLRRLVLSSQGQLSAVESAVGHLRQLALSR
jgi:hypothetical protein